MKKTIFGIACLVTVLCLSRSGAQAQDMQDTMSGKKPLNSPIAIHQETNFSASPQQLYAALISSGQFSECIKKSFPVFSKTSAVIDPTVGGSFSLFDGHITSRILELVPGQRIVEAWRVVDWPAGAYSIARFEFRPNGKGTTLVFDHVGFPEGLKDHLASGWKEHYWDALANYFR